MSKWERGLSLPDVGMLLPLAAALEVSVTELLESRRMDAGASPDMEQVEEIVKKAISFSGEKLSRRGGASRQVKLAFILCSCFSWAIAAYLFFTGGLESLPSGPMTMLVLCLIFGVYFTFFARDRLPDYYDDNYISSYSDGIFRLNLVGLRFSNRNWPWILKALRSWCRWAQLVLMLSFLIMRTWFPDMKIGPYLPVILSVFVLSLFVSVYITAKKHE